MALALQAREDLSAAPVAVVKLRDLINRADCEYGARYRLPAPAVAEVLRLWDAGQTTTEIAEAVGISESAAARYVRKHRDRGAPRRPTHYGRVRKLLEERGPELRAAYEAGRTPEQLAAESGISPTTLRRYLVSEGVEIQTRLGRPERRGV